MARSLRGVEAMPEGRAQALLPGLEGTPLEVDDEETT